MSSDNDQHPPTASNTGGDSSKPAGPPPETKKDTINKWLNLVYIDREHLGNSLALTVDDFIKILATGHEYDTISWLDNNALELATVILTNVQKERSDIVIVPSNAAIGLAHIGLCMSGVDTFKEDDFSTKCYDAMLNESVRWIVVPVTDGMVRQAGKDNRTEARKSKAGKAKRTKERNEKAQEASVELIQEQDKMLVDNEQEDDQDDQDDKDDKDDKNDKNDKHGSLPEAIPSGGTHWGFMIIDKQKNDARWLDGHLKLKKNDNGKWYIDEMLNAGWVAGKILCGYEKVMNLERGRFTAATLKHVPHDTKNNSYAGDESSACGPWVFAMLEYILGHPQFLTCEGGLYSTFRPKHRRGHNHRMAFNSWASRRRIQKVIESEADRDLGDDKLPYKMSVRVLKSLNYFSTADLLRRAIPPGRRREPPPRRGRYGSSGKKPGNDDDDEDGGGGDDNDPGTQGPILDDDNNPELQEILRISLQMNQGGSAQEPQGYQDPTKSNNPPKPPSKPTSSRPPTFNLVTHGPMLATHIPHFASMASNQIRGWIGLLPGEIEKLAKPRNDWDQKAVLQKFFGGFDGLSESQKRCWLEHDPLFKGNDRVNIENVAEMLKERVKDIDGVLSLQGSSVFYPPSYLEDFAAKNSTGSETLEAGTKPVEENSGDCVDNLDDGAGENLGDHGNNSNSNGEAEENDPIPPQTKTPSGQPSGVGTHKRKHANENPDAPETKRQRLSRPDFLRMEPFELLPWLESVPDDKKASLFDKERNLIDPISARINLERIFNATFRIWAAEDDISETTRKELKEWRKMVIDKRDFIASTYPRHDNGLRSFLDKKLNRQGEDDWPDYSQDEAKWPDCWKKRKE